MILYFRDKKYLSEVIDCPMRLLFKSIFVFCIYFHIKGICSASIWFDLQWKILSCYSGSAQGEAKSAQLIGEAIANNPSFITLRKIEAAREIAGTISNSANRVFLNSDDLLLNLQEMDLNAAKFSTKWVNQWIQTPLFFLFFFFFHKTLLHDMIIRILI